MSRYCEEECERGEIVYYCIRPSGHFGAHEFDPPEYDPDDAEAQRIAEACADANTEHDRIEAEEAGRG